MVVYYVFAWICYIIYFLFRDLYKFGQLGESTVGRIVQDSFIWALVCLLAQTLWNVLRLGGHVYPVFAFFLYLGFLFLFDGDEKEVSGCRNFLKLFL